MSYKNTLPLGIVRPLVLGSLMALAVFVGGAPAYAGGDSCPSGSYITGLTITTEGLVYATCSSGTAGAARGGDYMFRGGDVFGYFLNSLGITLTTSPLNTLTDPSSWVDEFDCTRTTYQSTVHGILGSVSVPTSMPNDYSWVTGTCYDVPTLMLSYAAYTEIPSANGSISAVNLSCAPGSYLANLMLPLSALDYQRPDGFFTAQYALGTCVGIPPTVTLNASPLAVPYNGTTQLTWGASGDGAMSCTTGGPWTNSGMLSGSGWTAPLASNSTYTYQCSNYDSYAGGPLASLLQSVTVTVGACSLPWGGSINDGSSVTAYQSSSVASPATCVSQTRTCSNTYLSGKFTNQNCTVTQPPPIVNLYASPTTINSGQSSMLTWGSTYADSCNAVGGFSTGGAANNKTGVPTGPLTSTQDFQITCTGSGGTTLSNIATVTVINPQVSITAVPSRTPVGGGSAVISWNASQVTSCVTTGPGISGPGGVASSTTAYPDSQTVQLNARAIYSITCQTATGNPITKTATVNIGSPQTEF